MVAFANIHIGQEVEVRHNENILIGKVRYVGGLAGMKGDYVGIELKFAVGDSNGMFRGRHYFHVKPDHGIFTTAENIRFPPITRYLYNRYHTVGTTSSVDEELFHRPMPQIEDERRKPSEISSDFEEYSYRLCESPRPYSSLTFTNVLRTAKRYPLLHTVGNHIPAASMLRPLTATRFPYKSTPVHSEFAIADHQKSFSPSSSIPDYIDPSVLARKKQMAREWDKVRGSKSRNQHSSYNFRPAVTY